MSIDLEGMRWDPYVLVQGHEFRDFWKDYLTEQERNVLIIVGRGFDVRALDASAQLMGLGGVGERHAWLLRFDNGHLDSTERMAMTAQNENGYGSLFGSGLIKKLSIALGDAHRPTATSRNTKRAFGDKAALQAYDDIILDVSAVPRMVALTALAVLIAQLDDIAEKQGREINLHVTTAESVVSDRNVGSSSLSDVVTTVVGFSGSKNAESEEFMPRVWFPVLGEGQETRLLRIREDLMPDEICPVLPFPSREPRRGDEIMTSYQQTLFDDFQIEPRNILHASEFNPFEAYKQIFGAIERYRDALADLGGCKAYVSPLSSKLLSIGALLACYDHKARRGRNRKIDVGMPYVESVSYGDIGQFPDDPRELYSMWIRGTGES